MQIDTVEFVVHLLILGVLAALILSDSTSARAARLESFRRRQGVHLTEATAPLVSKALSRSRFWRRVGVLVTLLSGVTVTLPMGTWGRGDPATSADWLALLAGWFAGLAIAECRATALVAASQVRGAYLDRRRLRDYVTWSSLWRLTGFGVLVVAAAGWLAVRLIDAGDLRGEAAGVVAGFAVAALVLALTARRILMRPQPVGDNDIRAADEGLRARSLQLLMGGAIVDAAWLTAALLAIVGATYDPVAESGLQWYTAGGWGVLIALAGVVGGWEAGTQPTSRGSQASTATRLPHPSRAHS